MSNPTPSHTNLYSAVQALKRGNRPPPARRYPGGTSNPDPWAAAARQLRAHPPGSASARLGALGAEIQDAEAKAGMQGLQIADHALYRQITLAVQAYPVHRQNLTAEKPCCAPQQSITPLFEGRNSFSTQLSISQRVIPDK